MAVGCRWGNGSEMVAAFGRTKTRRSTVIGSTGNFLAKATSSSGLIAPRANRNSSHSGLFSTPWTSTLMNAAASPGTTARAAGTSAARTEAGSASATRAQAWAIHERDIRGLRVRFDGHADL